MYLFGEFKFLCNEFHVTVLICALWSTWGKYIKINLVISLY